MRVLLLLLLCSKFGCVSLFAQTEVKIHPAQIGLFSASNGSVFTANTAGDGGQWSTAGNVVQAGLPTASIGNTLRHNGSQWVVATNLLNDGNFVGINTTPTVLLHMARPGNDAFMRLEGYDAEAKVGGNGTLSATFVLESINSGLREVVTRVVPSARSTELLEYYGARDVSRWDGKSGTVATQSGYPFFQRVWNSGGILEYGFVNKGIDASFSSSDLTWLFQVNKDGSFRASNLQGTGVRLAQCASDGKVQASSTLVSDVLTTGSTFAGDVSGSAANLQIIAGAVGSAEIANGSVTSTDLNNTGVTSGTYGSAANIPSIIVGTDGRIISASNVAATNLYSADGTIPSGTRTVTMSDGSSIRIDASGNSTSPFSPLIIRGNASTYATRFLEFEDSDGTMRFRGLANATNVILSSTTRPVELSGSTYSRISAASAWLQVESGGFVTINGASSDPGSPANNSFWINTTALRLKTRLNSTTYQVADIERDLIGDAPNARSASFTMPAQQFYTVADANGGSFTITFDATMREGIDYVIECRRNGTNTITFDAGSGYNLAVDTVSTFPDDGAVAMGGAGGTGIQAAHKVYYVRRHGTSISVK